jgi:hypothetical protein
MKLSLCDWLARRGSGLESGVQMTFFWDPQSFPTLIERNNQTLASDCADKSAWSGCSTKSDRMEIRLHKTEAATAAEKFAMHRMTQLTSNRLSEGSGMPENAGRKFRIAGFTLALLGFALLSPRAAQSQVIQADADYEAAGYVTPAGMVPPTMYQGAVQPVGFFSGSPASSCDAYGGCDSCPSGGCDSGYGGCDGAGGCSSCSSGGCGILGCGGGGHWDLSRFCIFCRGSGCEACQLTSLIGSGQILGMIGALRPYSEAGLCSQRWYDLSAEALFLSHDSGGFGGGVTSQGIGGPIVLSVADADA